MTLLDELRVDVCQPMEVCHALTAIQFRRRPLPNHLMLVRFRYQSNSAFKHEAKISRHRLQWGLHSDAEIGNLN